MDQVLLPPETVRLLRGLLKHRYLPVSMNPTAKDAAVSLYRRRLRRAMRR